MKLPLIEIQGKDIRIGDFISIGEYKYLYAYKVNVNTLYAWVNEGHLFYLDQDLEVFRNWAIDETITK